jgi:hypothetical protein
VLIALLSGHKVGHVLAVSRPSRWGDGSAIIE